METYVSIYGAALATLLAIIQINQYLKERKFLRINDFRILWSGDQIFLSFIISNRSSISVHLTDCMLRYTKVKYGTTGFELKAHGVRDGFSDKHYLLGPGEAVKISFNRNKIVETFGEFEELPPLELQVSHSRSDRPMKFRVPSRRAMLIAPIWKYMRSFKCRQK